MKLNFSLLGSLCLFFLASAHAQTDRKYLKAGDPMPDLTLFDILNARSKTIRIADLKGKVIFLDFWNSYCASCIAGFPKLDSLQRQFNGKLQVILINPANSSETLRSMKIVLDRMNSWSDQRFTLPIAFHDTTVSKKFEFYGVPFGVMIGPDGTIAGMPEKSEVTANNINRLLAGERVSFKQKVQRKPVPAGKAAL